jgi:hypothetical protein
MRVRSIALSALLIIGGTVMPLGAQQAAAPTTSGDIDVSKLPLNLARLQTKLRANIQREEQTGGPRIHYNIDVLGTAPRFKLISPEDNLRDSPIRNGVPNHQDMMNYATPKEFSSPAMDFNSLMKWIQKVTAKN